MLSLGTTANSVAESTMNRAELQAEIQPQRDPEQDPKNPKDGSERGQFKCEICNKKQTAQFLLTLVLCLHSLNWAQLTFFYRKHMLTHTRPYDCPLCDSATAARKDLHRHFWVSHPRYAKENNIPNDKMVCPYCQKESRSDNLKRHIKSQHGFQNSY